MTSPIPACDFAECTTAPATMRGAFQFCPQHAADFDTLESPLDWAHALPVLPALAEVGVAARKPVPRCDRCGTRAELVSKGPDGLAFCAECTAQPEQEHPLQTLLEGYVNECEIREYEGRGLRGEPCLAVVGSLRAIMAGIVEGCMQEGPDMHEDDRNLIEHAMRSMRTDSMGRATVVYWPGVPCVGSPEEV
jgi:hypothetical protein